MRLTSLLFLAVIVAAGVGVFGFNAFGLRDELFKQAKTGTESLQGYTAAESSMQAMDLFSKAIKNRKFNVAAKYVTGNYSEQLTRAHDAARPMGEVIDEITNYAKNKGFNSPKAMILLERFDPFPPYFSASAQPLQKGEGKAIGVFKQETLPYTGTVNPQEYGQMEGVLPSLMHNCLFPRQIFTGVELVETPEGDKKVWKLKIDLPPPQIEAVTAYINNHKSLLSGLEIFRRDATNNRHDTKEEFTNRLLEVVRASK